MCTLMFEKHWPRWSYHKVSKNLPTTSAQTSKSRGCCTNQNVSPSSWKLQEWFAYSLARKLIASFLHSNSKLDCPYSFLESHGLELTLDLCSLLGLPMPVFLSTWAEPGFDLDSALVRRTQSSADFICLPATQKWWLRPDQSLWIYSRLQGRAS